MSGRKNGSHILRLSICLALMGAAPGWAENNGLMRLSSTLPINAEADLDIFRTATNCEWTLGPTMGKVSNASSGRIKSCSGKVKCKFEIEKNNQKTSFEISKFDVACFMAIDSCDPKACVVQQLQDSVDMSDAIDSPKRHIKGDGRLWYPSSEPSDSGAVQ